MTKRIRLSDIEEYRNADPDTKRKIKDAVGGRVVELILGKLNSSNSPVSGQGKFRRLEDGGKSILFEDGDLWASISYEQYRDGVEVGVFDQSQTGKAYGHNTGFKGHPTIKNGPKRQIIPDKEEKFKKDIISEIKRITKIAGENQEQD